jgi:hypothetical protein
MIIMVRRTNFNKEIRTSYGSMLAVDLKNRSKPEFSTAKDSISAFNKNTGSTVKNDSLYMDLHTVYALQVNAIHLHGANTP